MYKKSSFRPKIIGGWDDNLEELEDKPKKTIGAKQQIQGLFSPSKMIDQVFSPKSAAESAVYKKEQFISKKGEVMIFSPKETSQERYIRQETEKILQELREQIILLEKSSKALSHEISKVKVEQLPQKSGIYYLIFFEWLIATIKQLVVKAEEGRSWLKTFTTYKKKKLGFWAMYQKKGTSYGLSQERVIARQVG